MLEFLLNFIERNLNILIVISLLVLCLSVYLNFVRKLVYLGISLLAIYYALVVLYKNGMGNTELYEFSKRVIILMCIIFENLINIIPNLTFAINRIYQMLISVPIDVYINLITISYGCIGIKILINSQILLKTKIIKEIDNIKTILNQKLIAKKNTSRFSYVIRC